MAPGLGEERCVGEVVPTAAKCVRARCELGAGPCDLCRIRKTKK